MATEQPPPPVLDGQICESIALRGAGGALVFGRGPDADGGDAGRRVGLDPGDSSISRRHARVERAADGGWVITDESRLGTTLNGESFEARRLVYGDRFRIGRYVFQFNGDRIIRLNEASSGAIHARDLGFSAGGRDILKAISLEIRPGEFVGILGGSGQGKSTLMNALCGIRPATAGRVFLNGRPLDEAVGAGARIGYVPQDDIVHPELVVRDAVLYAARLRLSLPARELRVLVDRTIDRLGLTPHAGKRIQNLSGGQRKRVSIATELLTRPDVLFLDEPSSGLDPATEESLMSLLQSLTLTGLTVVCTTHVLDRAYLFNRLLFIHGGRLVFSGTADDARRHFLLAGDAPADSQVLERSPLGRIYSLLGGGDVSAADWEERFRGSPYFREPEVPAADAGGTVAPGDGARRIPRTRVLRVLLGRQARILAADPLNLLFLLAQALAIGFLIGWVGSDLGLAAFLVLIASMWFGCSNGAQQIVTELPVFRRERVCGLGVATYIHSKILFLGSLTLVQTVLLAGTAFAASHAFHPRDFDADRFAGRIEERLRQERPDAGRTDAEAVAFQVVDEEDPTPAADGVEAEAADGATGARSGADPDFGLRVGALTWLAAWFDLGDNLLESGSETVRDTRGEPVLGEDGAPQVRRGYSPLAVAGITLGLRILALGGAAVVGVLLGLTISALVRNATQAVMWVPLILIPQILFGGFVVTLADMTPGARAFSRIMPSASLERIMEVSQVFGAATPFLSNRTKTPLFLTSDGAKETVEWERGGRSLSQDYDELSEFNTAWQNLAVIPERLGQHKHESTRVAGTTRRIFRDTVRSRGDVRYLKDTPFLHLGALGPSLLVLAGWIIACYLAVFAGLAAKQTA